MHGQGPGGRLQGHVTGDPEALFAVGLQHVGEAESLSSHLAWLRLLSGVCSAVALHVRPAGETLPADLTDKWLLT